jgi:superfamily II DNA or RNA helicase
MELVSSVIEDRAYQHDVVDRFRGHLLQGKRRGIIQAATGAGKTVIASIITRAAVDKGSQILFLAHSREIIHQTSGKLWNFGVGHGIIMAGEEWTPGTVQLASKDTLLARAVRRHRIPLPPADLIFIDECHRATSGGYKLLVELYPNAVLIGLSATPCRSDGRGLGVPTGPFEFIVEAIPSSELIRLGFLVPTRCFAPYRPDLKGVKITNGDYDKQEIARRMDRDQIVGDVVRWWKDCGEGRQTVVFASGVQHSMHLRDEFLREGITAEHLDAQTDLFERDGILERLADCTTRVVTNCAVLTEGWDCPPVSCCVDVAPTKSFVRYRQKVGRIQRSCEGKKDAIYLDHSGNIYRHGFPDDDVVWTLTSGKGKAHKLKKVEGRGEPIECPVCRTVFSGRPDCPNCGHRLQKRRVPKPVAQEHGLLVEVEKTPDELVAFERKQRHWHECLGIAANTGRTASAAAMMFKDRHGMPPWEVPGLQPMPPQLKAAWQTDAAELFPQYVRWRTRSGTG